MLATTLVLSLSLSASAAAAVLPRQSAATQVVKLASIENIAVRPNGQILATNMNSANLYSIDPVAKKSSVAVVISGAGGLSGIAEVAPDVFAIIGGKAIYRATFSADNLLQVARVGEIAGASNLNGLSAFGNGTVLVADAGKGAVYRFDVTTGASASVLSDPTMAPSGGIPFGIDGIKYRNGTVWYTNIFKNSFYKVPVDETGKATGAVTTLWTNLMGDDLCFGPNGHIFVATNGKNSVVEVDPAVGKPNSVATVSGSTSCAFGRTASDQNIMYVGGSQGVYAAALKL